MYASHHPRDQNCLRQPRAPARETSGYSSGESQQQGTCFSVQAAPLGPEVQALTSVSVFEVTPVSHTHRQGESTAGLQAVKKLCVQGFLSSQCNCLVSFDFSVFLFCWHLCILSVRYAFDTLVIFVNLELSFILQMWQRHLRVVRG